MRRGYWTGFLLGGLIGALAFRAYGTEIDEWLHTKLGLQEEEQPLPATLTGAALQTQQHCNQI